MRREVFARCAKVDKAQAMLVSNPHDVRYLSGFTGEDSWLLFGRDWARLITDARFAEQAERECGDIEVAIRTGRLPEAAVEGVKRHRVRRLAFQSVHMTVHVRDALAALMPRVRLVGVENVVRALRAVKTDREVRAIRKAVRVAEAAFTELISGGAKAFVGQTERAVAARLDYLMCAAGASGTAFPTILAAGAHASQCHYQPASAVIRADQAVLIDWGARVEGYCSDLTRVVFTGRIPPRIGELYDVVLRAQSAGIAKIRPGVACKNVDAAARDVITAAGYGKEFRHSLGHGIGLVVHEGPGLARTETCRLRSGMVVTVEPGIYLPRIGGVRIEDDVLVTPKGRRRLSSLPRDTETMVLR